MSDLLPRIDVVILAGGLGTRLDPVPGDLPKCLRPVAGRPFIEHLLAQLRRQGARRIILSLGHRHDAFERHLAVRPDDGLELVTSVEPEPLGTGGGLRFANPLIRSLQVLVLNGDSFVDAPLERLVERHRGRRADATLLACRVPDVSRFGTLELTEHDCVAAFHEKGATGPGYINAGVYVLPRPLVARIPGGRPVSLEREVFPGMVGPSFSALRGEWPFIDIGTPESLAAAETFFAKE